MLLGYQTRVVGLSVFASSLFSNVAATLSSDFILKSSSQPPAGWEATGRPSPSQPITLRIALTQPNLPQLEQHLLEISDPSHARWREHLSKEEVETLSAPSEEGLTAVDNWLALFGIHTSTNSKYHSERTPAKDWLIVHDLPISLAERLLNTTYSTYTHASTGRKLVRTTSYRLPSHVAPHVDVVQPTDYFGSTLSPLVSGLKIEPAAAGAKQGSLKEAAAAPPFNLTLAQLKDLYRTTGYKPSGKHSLLGVTG